MIHVINIMANNSSVPYFNWFAEKAQEYPDIKLSFIAMCKERPIMLDEMKEKNCDCYWIKLDVHKRKSSMLNSFFKLFFCSKKSSPM